MNKKFPKWILFLAIPCVLAATGYFALMQYYKVNIPYGTWVNDMYCTGFTYDEVAEQLLMSDNTVVNILVTDCDGKVHVIHPEKDLYTVSYEEALKEAISAFGAVGLFTEKSVYVEPVITIDKVKWEQYAESLDLFKAQDPVAASRMTIVETNTGFVLQDALEYTLEKEKALQVVLEAMEQGVETLSLVEAGCYYTPDYDEADKAVIAEFEALQAFCSKLNMPLTIQGETAYTVDSSVLKGWILKDKDGSYAYGKGGVLLLDEAKVKAYARSISEEVTTYWGKPWQFVTHGGETIEVEAGNYGRKLKTNNLSTTLINAFNTGNSTAYELEFTFYPEGAKEVEYGAGYGNSYVEVDIKGQHVYVYMDGEMVLDSPCVTGDVRRNRLTPTGVFYIEYKQRNRTLRGEDYATPVSYWMHFYNHCGFHDANWRRKFGEDIYLNDGSHGCVNMPPAKAKEMYGIVYSGMPVVVY